MSRRDRDYGTPEYQHHSSLKSEYRSHPSSDSDRELDGHDLQATSERVRARLMDNLRVMEAGFENLNTMMSEMSKMMQIQQKLANKMLELEEAEIRKLELENNLLEENNRSSKTNSIISKRSQWQTGPNGRCFRCNKGGHTLAECPLVEYGLWFCYYCQAVKSHKGTNCNNKGDRPRKPYKVHNNMDDMKDSKRRRMK